jgi:hypothetical protein
MATSFLYVRDNNGNESCTDYNKVKTPYGASEVNSWHVQGTSLNQIMLPLCQLIRNKLTRKDDLPIYVGNTGYIHLNDYKTLNFPDCWTEDDLGRTVFVFENWIYFQRYKSGGCIVRMNLTNYINGWDVLTKEEEQELVSKIN